MNIFNYPEKILIIEVLERLIRIKRTLINVDGIDSGEIKIKKLLKDTLKKLEELLEERVIKVLSLEKKLDEFERVSIVRSISHVFNALDELHELLQFVRSQGVRTETNILVENILSFIPANKSIQDVSVVLSNRYAFEGADLHQYLRKLILNSFSIEPPDNKNPTLFLPTIERQNPLNWAILAHECGHFQTDTINSLQKELKRKDCKYQDIFSNWIEEVFCDIFAAKILGPAYISCYIAFTLMTAASGESEISNDTHPADFIRINLIEQILDRSNLKINFSTKALSSEVTLDEGDLTSFFLKLVNKRSNNDIYLSEFRKFDKDILKGDETDIISEKIDNILKLNKNLVTSDFQRVPQLVERIHNGILISAFPFHNKANAMELIKKSSGLEENSPDKRLHVLRAIEESRTTIWEILNAGWLYKVEYLYPEVSAILFDDKQLSIAEKIENFKSKLERLDGILLKSIEASEVYKLFGENSGTDR